MTAPTGVYFPTFFRSIFPSSTTGLKEDLSIPRSYTYLTTSSKKLHLPHLLVFPDHQERTISQVMSYPCIKLMFFWIHSLFLLLYANYIDLIYSRNLGRQKEMLGLLPIFRCLMPPMFYV